MKRGPWDPVEDALVITRTGEGASVPAIATELDRPIPATYARSRQLGLLRQVHESWSEEAKARLTILATGPIGLRDTDIAADLKRTVGSIRSMMGELGLIETRTKYVPPPRPKRTSPLVQARRAAAETGRAARAAEKARAALATEARIAAAAEARAKADVARRDRLKAEADTRRLAQEARARDQVARQTAAVVARHMASDARRQERAAHRSSRSDLRTQGAEVRGAGRSARPSPVQISRSAEPVAPTKVRPSALEAERRKRNTEVARAILARPEPAAKKTVVVTGLSPMTIPGPSAETVSGRGGWMRTRQRVVTPSGAQCSARELSAAAREAVALFQKERGMTRIDPDPNEMLVTYLRRRGYVVVPETDPDGKAMRWMIDHRHRITDPGALRRFAEARGYA
jgi:hypothetical protein